MEYVYVCVFVIMCVCILFSYNITQVGTVNLFVGVIILTYYYVNGIVHVSSDDEEVSLNNVRCERTSDECLLECILNVSSIFFSFSLLFFFSFLLRNRKKKYTYVITLLERAAYKRSIQCRNVIKKLVFHSL